MCSLSNVAMSQQPGHEDEDAPLSSSCEADSADSQTTFEFTAENVQRFTEQQVDRAVPLYSISCNVEGYVEDSQCRQAEWETGGVEETVSDDEQSPRDFLDKTKAASQSMSPRGCSSEYEEIRAFDGRVVSRMSTMTQTNWDWVAHVRHEEDMCPVEIKTEEAISKPHVVESVTTPHGLDTCPDIEKEDSEMSLDNEVVNLTSKDPSTHPACQTTKQSPSSFDMITRESSSDSSGELLDSELDIPCEYCQQPRKPPVTRDQLVNNTDPDELFCCEVAWRMVEFLLEEEQAMFAAIQGSTKIDVGPQPPFEKAAKERAEQRLKEWEIQKKKSPESNKRQFSCKQRAKVNLPNTICYRLSNEVWTAEAETTIPEMEIIDSPNTLTLYGGEQGHKRKKTLFKLYDSGHTFITIFPDETGQVYYPSGRLAILISAVKAADFTYVILEDKDFLPNIQAIFTTRGQATCYHPNGRIWVNLTQVGGCCCTDTGALRRRWSWLEHKLHVHAPPFQPICLTLNPNIDIRIQTQDHVYVTFTSHKCSVRLNVGARFKLDQAKGMMLPAPDMVQRHLQLKSAEIYSQLQRIQSYIYQQSLSPQTVKSKYSLISQLERLRTSLDKQRTAKKTTAPLVTKNL